VADDDGDWMPDVRHEAPDPVKRFALSLVAWGLLCVFASGVSGLCVRLFRWAALE
jgi:hypothetical protein